MISGQHDEYGHSARRAGSIAERIEDPTIAGVLAGSIFGGLPMRLAYLSAPILGLLLVGCGPDEDLEREVPPPQPTTEQPAAPTTGTPPANTGTTGSGTTGTGTTGTTGSATTGTGTTGGVETDSGTGVANPGAMDNSDTGSGLGTESGAGTEPNPTGAGQ